MERYPKGFWAVLLGQPNRGGKWQSGLFGGHHEHHHQIAITFPWSRANQFITGKCTITIINHPIAIIGSDDYYM